MHTSCALENAWKGNVACPVCRKLPLPLNRYDIEDNQDAALFHHNLLEMQRLFIKGVRLHRRGQAKGAVKKAVVEYDEFVKKEKHRKEQLRLQKVIETKMKKEMESVVNEVKARLKTELQDAGLNARFMTTFRVIGQTKMHSKSNAALNAKKRKIARACGWQPHRAL